MELITSTIISFLIMLNPFAMFLYLTPVRETLSHENFTKVLLKATLISFVVFALFMVVGEVLFEKVFRINFESFRIFGGVVIFSLSYLYIVKGQKALVHLHENLDDLASEIALPFMVGAGTISLAILMSRNLSLTAGFLSLAAILSTNYLLILLLKLARDKISKKKYVVAFDKNMEVALRLMGFFLGAIGVNMVVKGITNLGFL